MSQKFRLVKRYSVVGDKTSTEKYYAVVRSTGSSDIDYLCKMIAARSTVSSADAKAVLDNLNFVIDFELQAGRIVHLGELGNFRMTIGSEGVEDESSFNKSMLRMPRIVFRPGKALQSTRLLTKFTQVKESGKEEEGNDIEVSGDL